MTSLLNPQPSGFLIDTHILLWLVFEDANLKDPERLMQLAQQHGGLWVSVMTLWEIAQLNARHRLSLEVSCSVWIARTLDSPWLNVLPLCPEIAVQANFLPDDLHKDPVDRILVASARVHGLTLITRDEKILSYAQQGHVRAEAA